MNRMFYQFNCKNNCNYLRFSLKKSRKKNYLIRYNIKIENFIVHLEFCIIENSRDLGGNRFTSVTFFIHLLKSRQLE